MVNDENKDASNKNEKTYVFSFYLFYLRIN